MINFCKVCLLAAAALLVASPSNHARASMVFLPDLTVGGAPGSLQYNNGGTSLGGAVLGGDCTFAVPNITCTKTGGAAFAPSATTDTTNAGNVSSGTLAQPRLPAITPTGQSTARALGDWFADRINVKGEGAKEDTLGYTDSVMTAGSSAFASPSATFTSADVGKKVIQQGAGTAGAPLETTFASFVDAHDMTTAANAVTTPLPGALSATPATAQSGAGSYAPGDTLTCTGGTGTACVFGITTTQVVSASINAAGSGGTNGACVLYGTTGVGDVLFSINATIASGAISALGSIVSGGSYQSNPVSLTAEPVLGCGLSGATLTLIMGVSAVGVQTAGAYSVNPTNPVTTTTSGSGTGNTLTITFSTGGIYTYGTDDTAAWTAAINRANAIYAAGGEALIYAPAGSSTISAALPQFTGPGCVVGDGTKYSNIVVTPAESGDLFSWSGTSYLASLPPNGPTIAGLSTQRSNPCIRDLNIIGDLGIANTQNAFMFYDKVDKLVVDGVTVNFMNGTCFGAGTEQNDTNAWLRESHIDNLELRNCGNATHPAMHLTSQGTQDATNNVFGHNWKIFFPGGAGLVIDNSNLRSTVRRVQVDGLLVHGISTPTSPIAANLFTIGSDTLHGVVHDIDITKFVGDHAYTGQYTVRTTAPDASSIPYDIRIEGTIPGGANGIDINAGRAIHITSQNISTVGPDITVGAAPMVGPGILIDPPAAASTFVYSIDPSALADVQKPECLSGDPSANVTTNHVPEFHDINGCLKDSGLGAPGSPIVGTTDTQTLTNKSIAASEVNSGNLSFSHLPTIADGDVYGNTSGSGAVPAATTVTGLLDHVLGNAQGDILYRGASTWTLLTPGTSGQSLCTGGASANPSWCSNRGSKSFASTATQAVGVTAYYPCEGLAASAALSESQVNQPVPFSGTFKNFYGEALAPPGVGNTITFTLRVNGASPASGPTCQLSGSGSAICSDTTDTATIAANQTCDVQVVTSASATVTKMQAAVEFDNP